MSRSMASRRMAAAGMASAMLVTGLTAALAAPAQAAFTPTKTSAITVDVDGTTLGIASTATDLTGPRSGVFGGAVPPASGSNPGTNELTEMYPVKGGAFTNFLARGGVVLKTGGTCGASGTYYRQAQVTIGNLTSATKDVWLFYDPTVGPSINAPTPYFNDNANRISSTSNLPKLCDGTTPYASGAGVTASEATLPLGMTALRTTAGLKVERSTATSASFTVYVPLQFGSAGPSENFIALGIVVDYVDGTVNSTSCNSGLATVSFSRLTEMANGDSVIVDLDTPDSGFDGLRTVSLISGTSGTASGWSCTNDGVDTGVVSRLSDTTSDTAIFTHVYAPPWNSMTAQGFTEVMLPACSSPAAGDAPCVDTTSTGIFASDGTSALSPNPTTVVEAVFGNAGPSQAVMNVSMGLQTPSTSGFSIPANSIVKFRLSLPTSGTHHGLNFASVNFAQSAGNTRLRIDPAGSAATNAWSMNSSGSRTIVTVVGQARATSSAVNRQTWQESCQVSITGGSAGSTGCGENLTSSVGASQMVLTSVPATFGLSYNANPVMQTIAGGMVSTNAQSMVFGDETMTGTSFQFAVAGPSFDANDVSRSTDGFYFVCVPAAFLSGSFNTTPAAAAASWIGTRDGTQTSGVTFTTTTCGIGPGLLASYPQFGYSAPVFRVKPPDPPSSNPSSGSSSPTTSTAATAPAVTTTSTATTAPTTAPVAPAAYPSLGKGRSVGQAYLLGLADWTPSKAAAVSISVPRMFRNACEVKDGRVVAKAAGTCGVRITVVSPKGKTYVERVYLTVG